MAVEVSQIERVRVERQEVTVEVAGEVVSVSKVDGAIREREAYSFRPRGKSR